MKVYSEEKKMLSDKLFEASRINKVGVIGGFGQFKLKRSTRFFLGAEIRNAPQSSGIESGEIVIHLQLEIYYKNMYIDNYEFDDLLPVGQINHNFAIEVRSLLENNELLEEVLASEIAKKSDLTIEFDTDSGDTVNVIFTLSHCDFASITRVPIKDIKEIFSISSDAREGYNL